MSAVSVRRTQPAKLELAVSGAYPAIGRVLCFMNDELQQADILPDDAGRPAGMRFTKLADRRGFPVADAEPRDVSFETFGPSCDCPDAMFRDARCKHAQAAPVLLVVLLAASREVAS